MLLPNFSDEEILYCPPKGRVYGQRALARDPRKAWVQMTEFLDRFTASDIMPKIDLRCWEGKWTDPVVSAACIEEATTLFGAPGSEYGSWALHSEQLASALDFVFQDELRPKQDLGPTALHLSYEFRWLTHSSPDEKRLSWLGVTVGGRKTVYQPTFRFPTNLGNDEIQSFISDLAIWAPFKFNANYLRRLVPSKIGCAPRSVRLPHDWLSV